MIGRLGLRISAVFRATAPDPFVLAVLLTLLTFALAFTLTDSTPASLVDHWGGPSGVWSLLAFGMQMCLILVTGHALASSPPVSAVLNRLASLPRTGEFKVLEGAELPALEAPGTPHDRRDPIEQVVVHGEGEVASARGEVGRAPGRAEAPG